jgi:hypothetical protein
MRLILQRSNTGQCSTSMALEISLKTLSQIVSLGKPEVMLARYRQILLVLGKCVFCSSTASS